MKKKIVIFGLIIFAGILGILAYGYFEYKDVLFGVNTFAKGTYINGINVSELTCEEAQNVVSTKLLHERNNIKIELRYNDKRYVYTGDDFEIDNGVMPYVENVYNYFNSGSIFEKKIKYDKIKDNKNFNMPYTTMLVGIDAKIDAIKQELDIEVKDAQIVFDVKKENPLTITSEVVGREVDKEQLKLMIDKELLLNSQILVDIPVKTVMPTVTKEDLENSIKKRSSFFTDYHKSSLDRKFNVVRAIDCFNGLVVNPEEEISFNAQTGERSAENGYKKANIILNGVYVEGVGGGVCQASTTLYNALVCADIQILEVHKHTLPSSYVALGFDAMVSEGVSDLRFKNNTSYPLYIRTLHDDNKVGVEIYGQKLNDDTLLKTRTEFIEVILHPGDRIIQDTDGKYSNKVTYKGEYLRLKYPHEGYRVKAYLDKYVKGALVESKLLREEIYNAQEGIIIEGTEEVTEGITLPPNTVKFISPQTKSSTTTDNLQNKLFNDNPSNYNP